MKLSTHIILQVLGFAIQIGNLVSGVVPPKAQPYVLLVVSLAQAGLGWYNHNFNPDGTPASVAYIPPPK